MNWILTLKDHFSRLCYLMALPGKEAKFIAHELNKIFHLIGFPIVFQTDNERCLINALVVVTMLRDMNPLCKTICGRPRKPNDQGSVEVHNKLVKQTLENVRRTRKSEGKSDTWPNLLPTVTSIMNKSRNNRKTSYSSYDAVFHRSFDDDSNLRDEVYSKEDVE